MARLPFPNGVPYGAVRASASQESGTEKEYRVIFEAFRRFILHYENSAERLDIMEDIITLRASFLMDKALTGLRIDLDRALEILRNHNSFTTERERLQRDILIAAIDNLVDFAAAEEYAMFKDMPETVDERDMDTYGEICRRYNFIYAEREQPGAFRRFDGGMVAHGGYGYGADLYDAGRRTGTGVASVPRRALVPQIGIPAGVDTAH